MKNQLKTRETKIKSPHNIPMSFYINEAEALYHWALKDKEVLTAAGLDVEYINNLLGLCETATNAEAQLYVEVNAKKQSMIEWEKQAPIAFELRKELLHRFRLHFRDHPHLMEMLKEISRGGRRYAKLLQDLNDLSVLGRSNREILEGGHFDMSLLEKAAQASSDLAVLLAEATRDRLKPNEGKIIRDLAYTRLKEAVDEIHFYGRHVFRGNKGRLTAYRSDHIHELKMRQARKNKNNKTTKQEPNIKK
jgi:hypothetical protein